MFHSSVPGPHLGFGTQRRGSQRSVGVGGIFPGCRSLTEAECLRWTHISIWGPHAALEKARTPTSTCSLLAVSPPVRLVQSMGRPCLSWGPGSGVPSSSPLLDGILNRPPLSCAAAEDEVNARQATVLHLQAASGALIHNGSVLGRDGGKRRKKREKEGGTDGEREREA